MSTLYVGEELVAVHLGLRSDSVLHWWFPAYDRKYQAYSPGLILLHSLLRQCNEHGITRLDLGKGAERYKAQYKTGDLTLAIGGIDRRLWLQQIRLAWHAVKNTIRATPCKNQFENVMNFSNRLRRRTLLR